VGIYFHSFLFGNKNIDYISNKQISSFIKLLNTYSFVDIKQSPSLFIRSGSSNYVKFVNSVPIKKQKTEIKDTQSKQIETVEYLTI